MKNGSDVIGNESNATNIRNGLRKDDVYMEGKMGHKSSLVPYTFRK